ncbi:transport and Golgi organization protein 1 homolog isoform X2 [Lampris incognitus]|uniref:transport and Golgi organization protein 1 homolog isoform X2 n=1 Tax=Lampris incognitus TaxID=2546036 RepID=UPI0024B52FBF|nr:transport and Golgi organization protein 1 homolog isoform X2 [Lampris incognitus]
MAAKAFYRKGFLLLLFNFISTAALDKRFSDLKRCADEECSMLLVRGKAVSEFSAPDCRFLSFKKSETIYVYYKLSGRRADVWAGSVGNRFGYFPKELLAVNHIYTEKEVEVSAEETDFVCFDTGYDKFDSYDIDALLASTMVMEENEEKKVDTTDQIEVVEDAEEEIEPSTDELIDDENKNDDHDNFQDLNRVPGDQSASMSQHKNTSELLTTKVAPHTEAASGAAEKGREDTEQVQQTAMAAAAEHVSENSETSKTHKSPEVESLPKEDPDLENESESFSKGREIHELHTTLGTTFDAVTTDDEDTWKVTSYREGVGESEELEEYTHDNTDTDNNTKKGPPLLSFSTEEANTLESDPSLKEESPPTARVDDQQTSEDENVWTSIGDTVFAIVSGGEKTSDVYSSEEDEDEEENDSEHSPSTEEVKEEEIQLLSAEVLKEPEDKELAIMDSPTSSSQETGGKEPNKDPESLLFDNEINGDVTGSEEYHDEMSTLPAAEQSSHRKTEESTTARNDGAADALPHEKDGKTLEPTEENLSEHSAGQDDGSHIHDSSTTKHREHLANNFEQDEKLIRHHELSSTETETNKDLPFEKETWQMSDFKDRDFNEEKKDSENLLDKYSEHSVTDVEKDESKHTSHLALSSDETELNKVLHKGDEEEPLNEPEVEEKEGLLEDENAVLSSKSQTKSNILSSTSEPEYSDSVLRLTVLRDHFQEEDMERFQKFLGLKNLFKLEAMFSDLDMELQAALLSNRGTIEDIEKSLEGILEVSENSILDELEKMLDSRNSKDSDIQKMDTSMFDEEAKILDDFQELAFSLRQKYSAHSDSTPLATDGVSPVHQEDDDTLHFKEEVVIPPAVEEKSDFTGAEKDDNLTVTDTEESSPEEDKEHAPLDKTHGGADFSVEEDGGHFNKNKDNQPSFSTTEDMQKTPQPILENTFDMGLGVEVEHSSSVSLDSKEPVSDILEEELGIFSTGMLYTVCLVDMVKNKTEEWTNEMISLLPEEWKPGETLFGCPWQAVLITALVGVITFTFIFWRTILAVKKREYLVDEKGLNNKMVALQKEKNEATLKISQLQKQTEELKEKRKLSEETASCALKRNEELQNKVLEAETQNEQLSEEKKTYAKLLEEERANSLKNESRIEKLEKSNEKLQLSRKKTQEALAKTTILLDEAKIREDARNVQHKCLERDYAALKEESKTLKSTIKEWEGKHMELSEQIKVYQKSQKELEDSVVLKDHNVEVLSDLLADLDACDLQKSDSKALANGEVAIDKKTAIKVRIKQMMDVSRVQTTLTVVEEERDRFMTKLLNEENARKALEEQHRELEHSIATLKSDKSHVENQFKILQQKNEIMCEMYQQKENALQQRLTKEELERRSKESLLSEVGGKAVEAEEQVKVLRQRINEMEEQMKKTEEVYKEQIKEQENKTHHNWVTARNAERTLNQEKVETSKLREKLAVLTSQLNERRAPLFRPSSGQPIGPRQGDSYGPSPVSGGAPSPPLMIEGPRRPPSAPVGRRIDPYGPRPPSDPHSRYHDNKHVSGIDMMAPRTSSPANIDGSGLGSFQASPIRDPPASMVQGPPPAPGSQGPPPGPGPHDPFSPPGPHNRLPPPGTYRPPRPGPGSHGPLYHPPAGMTGPHVPLAHDVPPHGPPRPPNGHPGLPPPGAMGADFGPRLSNGHAIRPRLGPGHAPDPRGPPPPHFRPHPPPHFGPMPPPHGIRGPMGPRPPFPPDMRFQGPRDHAYPPVHLRSGGVAPPPPHGDAFVQASPEGQHISVGPQTGPGQGENFPIKHEADQQDSVRSAMAEP